MKYLFLLSVLTFSLLGCAEQTMDRYKDRAIAEQEAANQAANDNLTQKAQEMETALAKRHAFYSAIEGQFEGRIQANGEDYGIRVTLTKSLPPYNEARVRQLSEIESDINNLHLNVQILQWHPADPTSAVPCRVSGIRPDTEAGTLTISSPECSNLYQIWLAERPMSEKSLHSKSVARRIRDQEITQVPLVLGVILPSTVPATYNFQASRVQ